MKYLEKLQVVLKISERCNLSCSYCYYFKGENNSAYTKPPLMKKEVINKLINDITKILDSGTTIGILNIIFHGGEPLLIKPSNLKFIIKNFVDAFDHRLNLEIGIQTNGTLISDEFIDVVNHFSIGVGVSIDGIKSHHNKSRIYPSGKGSFDDVVKGIIKLQSEIKGTTPDIGVISVLTDKFKALDTYSYLVDELGIKRISFLLPDTNYDNYKKSPLLDGIGKSLYDCFLKWTSNTSVNFKNVVDFINSFQSIEYKPLEGLDLSYEKLSDIAAFRLIVLRSDGELHHYDRFLPKASEKYLFSLNKNIMNVYLLDYLKSDVFREINNLYNNLSNICTSCEFVKFCNGGDLEHRFSKINGFDNPSVYCNDLKYFFREITKDLNNAGLNE